MDCPNCGHPNPAGTRFCGGCGQQIPASAPDEAVEAETVSAAGAAAAAVAQGGSPAPAPAAPTVATAVEYEQGCLATAWSDIRASEGWVRKMLLLGLIMIVPILNFVVPGYAMGWARDAARGERYQLPEHIFGDGNFKLGFFGFVVGLVFIIVTQFAVCILALVPILGQLAGIALTIACSMAICLAYVRIALAGRIGAGFALGEIWKAGKEEPGKLFCATELGTLIVCAVAGAVVTALVIAGCMALGLSGAALYTGYSSSAAAGAAVGGGIGAVLGVVLIVAACFALAVASALVSVLAYRATGIFVDRYAPSWKSDCQ